MITMKSESANKTQQNNAKILFGSKGVSVLTKLEEYSKEKALDTAGIDAVLDVLKTKDATLLQKFADSKTGKTLAKNCKQLAAAKTFTAIIKNIKQIKVLKSFDKFGAVPSKAPARKKQTPAKLSTNTVFDIFNQVTPTEDGDVETTTKSFKRLTGINAALVYRYTPEWYDRKDEALAVLPKFGEETYVYYVPAGYGKGLARELGVKGTHSFIFADTNAQDGPFHDGLNLVPGSLKVATSRAEEREVHKLFMDWVKNGFPKPATPPYIVKDFKGYKSEERNIMSRLTSSQKSAITDISDDLGDIYVKSEKRAGKIVWDAVVAAGLDPAYVTENLTLSDPIKGRINLAEDEIYIMFNSIVPKYRNALIKAFQQKL